MTSLNKRLKDMEKAYREVLARNYLTAVIIRSDDDMKLHKANIGPETKVIKIVARKERVNSG